MVPAGIGAFCTRAYSLSSSARLARASLAPVFSIVRMNPLMRSCRGVGRPLYPIKPKNSISPHPTKQKRVLCRRRSGVTEPLCFRQIGFAAAAAGLRPSFAFIDVQQTGHTIG